MLITARGLILLEAFMQSRGLDYHRAVRDVGIDPAVVQDPEAELPLRSIMQLMENVARESGNDAFGTQVGASYQIGLVGASDYAMCNAPTLRAALTDYVRYLGLAAKGLNARFVEGPGKSYVSWDLPAALGPHTQFIGAVLAAQAVRIRHIMCDPSFPIFVDLQRSSPQALDEFTRIFGPRVCFEQPHDRIGVPTNTLNRPPGAADPQLYRVIVRCAEKALAERDEASDTVLRLTSHITEALPHGPVDFAAAAKSVGMSPRELRRELEREHTTFRDLVDETRKTLTAHYINDTALAMTEIAFLIGFSQLSAFSRAVKKWFGTAPRELRKKRRSRRSG
ncbi:MAG TPA: AraC family transcriptional regulator [Hyphomicrobiaceae bacterium]|nr:AraC family transcriptional regulator [Hyphomicrobiaceae bacterium]